MALIQLPSVQRSRSLLRILGVEEVDEGEALGETRGLVEGVRQPILRDRAHPAEDLPHHASKFLVLSLNNLRGKQEDGNT